MKRFSRLGDLSLVSTLGTNRVKIDPKELKRPPSPHLKQASSRHSTHRIPSGCSRTRNSPRHHRDPTRIFYSRRLTLSP